jgi:REP element-mobilizing transposase RayT
MKYNPAIHHSRSIRLKGYDYSQAGMYFVTTCVQNRECMFGKIMDGEMALNAAGKMIEKWCVELPHKFLDIVMDTYIIMPNHFHAIIVNNGIPITVPVGADLRVCPDGPDTLGEHMSGEHTLGEHTGSPLHAVVQWFKTMTTNEYIRGVKTLDWKPFNKKLWQRNYWEHIIRNEQSYQRIADYIANNPALWEKDKLFN